MEASLLRRAPWREEANGGAKPFGVRGLLNLINYSVGGILVEEGNVGGLLVEEASLEGWGPVWMQSLLAVGVQNM